MKTKKKLRKRLRNTKRKRIPKKIREIMEREVRRQESKLLKGVGVLLKHDLKYPQNEIGMVEVKTMDEEWLKPQGGTWRNPHTGKTESMKIAEFITYEKGRIKVKGKLEECIRQIHLKPEEVKPFFGKVFQKAKKDKQLSELVEGANFWGDVGASGFWSGTGTLNSGKILPFPPGPFTRQIYLQDQWKMLSRAASLSDYNPLAKAGIWIKTAFTVGVGPKIQIDNNPKLQDAVDKFWEVNDFTNRLKMYDRMLTTNGEFMGEITDSEDGTSYRHTSIDPGTVYDIITEPRDIEKVYGYQLIYPTQYQMYGTGAKGQQVPLNQFIYETASPDNIIHIKINVQENEKRGRSDLLPVLNICQFFEDYIRFTVLKTIVQASFTWDIKMTNADEADVTAMQQNENGTMPVPLSTFVHNENVERTPMQYSGGRGGQSDTFTELIASFAIGFLMPKEYLNAGTGGTRATAITATEPAAKIFLDRRGVWESYLRKIVFFIAKKEGIKVEIGDIEVTWPEIAPENVTEKIKNILIGVQENFISLTRAAEMYGKEMDIRSYDSADEFKRIIKEKQDAVIGQFYQQDLVNIPTDLGGGGAGKPAGGTGASSPIQKGKPIDNPSSKVAQPEDYQNPNGITNGQKKDIKAVGQP